MKSMKQERFLTQLKEYIHDQIVLALKFGFFYFRKIPLYYRLMVLPSSVQIKVIEQTPNKFIAKKDPVLRSISSCKKRQMKDSKSIVDDKQCALRVFHFTRLYLPSALLLFKLMSSLLTTTLLKVHHQQRDVDQQKIAYRPTFHQTHSSTQK